MSESFQIGDVVMIKSGGPKMTVTHVGNDAGGDMTVWCKWFSNEKESQGAYPVGAVEKIS